MDTLLLFTGRSIEQMIEEGGSQAWALDAARARRCAYLVCTQNRHSDIHRSGRAAHGAAFMVAKLDDAVDSTEEAGRYTVTFSEFARVDIPNVWGGWRNPVKYTTLEDLGIDPATLNFEPISTKSEGPAALSRQPTSRVASMPPDAAKQAIAAYFGVPVDAVEITIRT